MKLGDTVFAGVAVVGLAFATSMPLFEDPRPAHVQALDHYFYGRVTVLESEELEDGDFLITYQHPDCPPRTDRFMIREKRVAEIRPEIDYRIAAQPYVIVNSRNSAVSE